MFHIPFLLALVAGVAAAVPLGLIFGLPAVRTRGINLAIVTLGLGTAIELMLFSNRDYTGGVQGTQVGNPDLFGFEIGSIKHPERYGIFVLVMALLAVLVVANVRRGRSGRRLIAVRTNERAAAALGHRRDRRQALRVLAGLGDRRARAASSWRSGSARSATSRSPTSRRSPTSAWRSSAASAICSARSSAATMATAGFNQEVLESTWDGRRRVDPADQRHRDPADRAGYKDGVAAEWVKIFRLIKKARRSGASRTPSSSPTSPTRRRATDDHAGCPRRP